MIGHQQILYKSKKSFKITKADPFFELPDYDFIQFNKEEIIEEPKDIFSLIKNHNKIYQNLNQRWLYRFVNKKLNIDIEIINIKNFCEFNNFNDTFIRKYIKSRKPYKGFIITRKLINEY